MNNFVEELNRVSTLKETENGGLSYSIDALNNPLVKAFYSIGSSRKDDSKLIEYFNEALKNEQTKNYCGPFAMMVRDIKEGAGERTIGRKLLAIALDNQLIGVDELVNALTNNHYGRWDDVIEINGLVENGWISDKIVERVKNQFKEDVTNLLNDKSVSLLGKWLPSINCASKRTRILGRKWAATFGLSLIQYRKVLSKLRQKIDIVERKLCAQEFDKIEYPHVPSLAHIRYAQTFSDHDYDRYHQYLDNVKANKAKINTFGTTAPEIVHLCRTTDETAETIWANRKKYPFNHNVIGVCDCSGSMWSSIGGKLQAIDVSIGLSLYLAEMNTGAFHNKVISFSDDAHVIDLDKYKTFGEKVRALDNENHLTTNIESVLNTVYNIAVNSHCEQKEIPTIVIFSDMEFNSAYSSYQFHFNGDNFHTLFEQWREKFYNAGYQLPKLVFWNINNRSETVPLRVNANGLILVSGFNENLIKMVLSACYDPWNALVETLSNERYRKFNTAV